MQIIQKSKCSGCGACFSACPSKAISMQKDIEGFLYPIVDEKKCTKCGLCKKTCPILNNKYIKKNQNSNPNCYAGWNKDESVRKNSSSGGIFSVIAKYILNKKGYVCGASFEDHNRLKHIIICDEKDLPKLRGSKYLQSEIGNVFIEIKNLLENDNWVLFTGTPCQAVGLKNYLKKEYEKLLIVDIICHGVPSPLVFEKYLKEVEEVNSKKIEKINFRDKSLGWKNPQIVLTSEKGSDLIKKSLFGDIYGRGFLTNLFLRNICTDCVFSQWPKASDITLGDFWGIWKYNPGLDDGKGTSLIMPNNGKGEFVINSIKESIAEFTNVPSSVAIDNNYPVIISSDKHVNREEFFENFLEKSNISQLILKYLDDDNFGTNSNNNNVGILNFYYENYNFGANLVAYSLLIAVKKLGYSAKIINYNPFPEQTVFQKACSLNFYKFRQNFLKMTKICRTKEDLIKLNLQFDTFITGSDQVWRQLITGKNALHYFLDFVFKSKKRISYGASFGHNYWDGDEITTEKAKGLLGEFDSISVREREGLDILMDSFGISNADCVLDPTLLLNQKDYDELTKYSDNIKPERKYIAYYFLFDSAAGNNELEEKMREISKLTNFDTLNVKGKEDQIAGEKCFVYNSIPNFLDYIKNSSFVITDSYHGVIFSIIYKKDFLCIGKKSKALSRFENLFSLLNINLNGRFLSSLDEVNKELFSKNLDYKKVHEILEAEKEKSLNFLANSLKLSKSDKIKKEILEKELISAKLEKMQLQAESNNLQAENNNLQAEKNQLLNSKTFRYSKKVQQFLKKIGIEKL